MSEPGDSASEGRDGIEALVDRIEQARFTVAFRGFEPREVQDFLHALVDDLRHVEGGGDAGRGNAPPGPPAGAGRLRHRAESDAAAIIDAAREEADRILTQATLDADELRKEAATFREQARAAVLESIRNANALLERARRENSGLDPGLDA